jgi:Uma2 family endonuclease
VSTSALPTKRILAWAQRQPQDRRYELVDGEVIAMAPERVRHNLVKLAVARALQDAVKANLPCTVFTDGVTVMINDHTAREPDASVQCDGRLDPDSMIVESPVIVVEVVSPSSECDDIATKLLDYFAVASIRHYLIVFSEKAVVVHHQRNQAGGIETRIVHDGDVVLEPPGFAVSAGALLGPPFPGATEVRA